MPDRADHELLLRDFSSGVVADDLLRHVFADVVQMDRPERSLPLVG